MQALLVKVIMVVMVPFGLVVEVVVGVPQVLQLQVPQVQPRAVQVELV